MGILCILYLRTLLKCLLIYSSGLIYLLITVFINMFIIIKQNLMSPMITSGSLASQQMLSQASPAPLTPMTPHSADPGILPQLQ